MQNAEVSDGIWWSMNDGNLKLSMSALFSWNTLELLMVSGVRLSQKFDPLPESVSSGWTLKVSSAGAILRYPPVWGRHHSDESEKNLHFWWIVRYLHILSYGFPLILEGISPARHVWWHRCGYPPRNVHPSSDPSKWPKQWPSRWWLSGQFLGLLMG